MSEMEQLKKNAEEQKWNQTRDELVAYFDYLGTEIQTQDRWHERARSLELFVLIFHFACIVAMGVTGVDDVIASWISNASFLVLIVAWCRSSVFQTRYVAALAQYEGAKKALRIIGMLKDEPPEGKKKKLKRRSIFARYKEFWERMAAPDKQEAYA